MKRILGQSLSLVAIVMVGSVLTPACADDDGSIFVHSALAPPTSRTGSTCQYTADPTQASLSQGSLDVAIRESYSAQLLVGNQMIQRGDPTAPRAESNRVHLNGAIVRVTDGNGGDITSFTSVASGFVDAASGNQPSYGIAGVTALDATTVSNLRVGTGATRLVIANMKVFGKTIGGVDVESAEFSFPIRVCNGCSIDFSTGTDLAVSAQNCKGTTAPTLLPCAAGQDEPTPCQVCREIPACNP